jgi:hypothetical protein
LTRDEALQAINDACPQCRDGVPATPHLGGAEWLHSVHRDLGNRAAAFSCQMCLASDLRVKYQDVLNAS